jgi:diaminopimelate decarboxylase
VYPKGFPEGASEVFIYSMLDTYQTAFHVLDAGDLRREARYWRDIYSKSLVYYCEITYTVLKADKIDYFDTSPQN